MFHQRLTYHQAMKVLLEGISGARLNTIALESGLSRGAVINFMKNKEVHEATIDAIGWYIWKRMNSTVLLGPSDTDLNLDRSDEYGNRN